MGVMLLVMDQHGLRMSNVGGIGQSSCCVQQGHRDSCLFAANIVWPMWCGLLFVLVPVCNLD